VVIIVVVTIAMKNMERAVIEINGINVMMKMMILKDC